LCWSKGGGAEGQGPKWKGKKKQSKGKANKAAEGSDSDSDSDPDVPTSISCMAVSQCTSTFGWLKDSASTDHICKDKSSFAYLKPYRRTISGIQEDAKPLEATGIGVIYLRCAIPGKRDNVITLKNVLYAPKASDNLLSEGRMDKAGLKITIVDGVCTVRDQKRNPVIIGYRKHNLYHMDCVADPNYSGKTHVAFLAHHKNGIDLWHRCLAHLNTQSVYQLYKHKMVTGLDLPSKETLGP